MQDSEKILAEQLFMVIYKFCSRENIITFIDIENQLKSLFLPKEIHGDRFFGDGVSNIYYWNNMSSAFVFAMLKLWKEKEIGFFRCGKDVYKNVNPADLPIKLKNMAWQPIIMGRKSQNSLLNPLN